MCVDTCGLACKTHCDGCMNVAWVGFGEETGARNRTFFCVKWLQPAMKGTSCVRRVRFGSFRGQSIPSLCSATGGCKSHCNGCMNVAWGWFWGGSRSRKPCVFLCKVAAAAMMGTFCVRRVRFGSFQGRFLLCVLQRVGANRIVMAAWMCTWCCKICIVMAA